MWERIEAFRNGVICLAIMFAIAYGIGAALDYLDEIPHYTLD